ncbi:MAG: HD domain-containing protein [Candidatus Thorarchaeota archaeon]|nr:HD domain-containing protein [Candidatus Thorarchaeota archaeon]
MLPEDIIKSFMHAESMKRLERTGWNIAGVQLSRKESIAEHAWGTTFLSWLLSMHLISIGENVDIAKVLSMAMLHDLPESIISDIPRPAVTLGGNDLKEGKRRAEFAALVDILPPIKTLQENANTLLNDLDDGVTIESRIVKGADFLDMLLHAIALERGGAKATTLNQFFISSRESIQVLELEIVTGIYKILLKEHEGNL